VVIGGGAAGQFAALLLARAGHAITVLEQDRLPLAADAESAAAAAFRPTAPQIVQPHMLMGRCRELLIDRLPDVYAGLLAAGVAEAPLSVHMPETLADTSAWPGDERMTTLMTRRSTLDWLLLQTTIAESGVCLRRGVRVRGLVVRPGRPSHVTAVRTDHGQFGADVVIDATGRRSPLDRWLTEAGARPARWRRAECGLAYFSRHYRVRPGARLPGSAATRILAGLDEFTAGIWGADNGTLQFAIAPLAADRRFAGLRDPAVFTAVLRTLPVFAAWLDGLDPITGVFPMAGLHNTLRRLVVDGSPVATGLLAVGDSVCTTNPTLGRGLSLAIGGAAQLADAIAAHGPAWPDLALAVDAWTVEQVTPYYADQAALDAGRLAALRHSIFGDPAPVPPAVSPGVVTHSQLRVAARYDPAAFRGLWSIYAMIRRPDDVYRDPQVVAGTRAALGGQPAAEPQPTREQLRAALASPAARGGQTP
jgi:2-polyprenyl-6-methoxyphenol hydroxylase-like FAD-dependent oxidoreductase